jgi:antibiotic biosynthesis monooxygenase (ABM) superfamily enzyme
MATIDQRDNVFTSINVFTVKPENQDTLVNLVIEATNNTMRHLPGFVSTSIHRSPDNTASSTVHSGGRRRIRRDAH